MPKTQEGKQSRINGKQYTTGRRPLKFSQDLCDEICDRLTEGESIRQICDHDPRMPSKGTMLRWIGESESFAAQYTRARAMQSELMANEIIDIADEPIDPGDSAAVQRAKLRIDARKWTAMKLLPKKYGDKVEVEHSGEVKSVETLDPALKRQYARALLTARSGAGIESVDHIQDEEDSE